MKEIYKDIDKLIDSLKEKCDSSSYNFEDSKTILCLEIIRLELNQFNKISDKSWSAFITITGWSFHYNLGNNNNIHEQILALSTKIDHLNSNEYKADIEGPFAHEKEDWIQYFEETIRKIMNAK